MGDIPTYGLSGNREEDGQELMDFERELKEERIKYDEESKYRGAWNQIEIGEGDRNKSVGHVTIPMGGGDIISTVCK